MAKAVSIQASLRGQLGSRRARKIRTEGLLPCIIYGHGKENVAGAVPQHDFIHHLHRGVHLFELQLGDEKKETVLLKKVQYDYLGTNPIHVDFARVDLSEHVTVTVPVVLRGTPAGVSEGGTLQHLLTQLQIECLVTDIPEDLRVRVNDLKIGETLSAAQVPLPEGVKLITSPETAVASVTVVAEEEVAAAAEPVAQGAEPEVIARGKEEEAEEASE